MGHPIEDMPKRLNEAVLNPDEPDSSLTESDPSNFDTTTSINGKENTVHVFVNTLHYYPSYNIPPTSGGVIIYLKKDSLADFEYVIEPLKFGMLPVWMKPHDPQAVKRGTGYGPQYSREVQQNQAKYFNCRKETISQPKTMWNSAKNTRCVVPAQGYFEWKTDKKDKTPYFVHLKSSPLMFFAGLYSHNYHYNDTEMVPEDLEYFSSFAILTGPGKGKGSNDLLWLHSRKPIVLQPNSPEWFDWLDPNREFDNRLLESALNTDTNPGYDDVGSYVVAKSIGNTQNKGPEVLKEEKVKQKSIGLFFLLPKKVKEEVKPEKHEDRDIKKEVVEGRQIKKEEETNDEGELKNLKDQKIKQDHEWPRKRKAEPESKVNGPESIAKRVRQEHQGSEYTMGYRRNESEDDNDSEDD